MSRPVEIFGPPATSLFVCSPGRYAGFFCGSDRLRRLAALCLEEFAGFLGRGVTVTSRPSALRTPKSAGPSLELGSFVTTGIPGVRLPSVTLGFSLGLKRIRLRKKSLVPIVLRTHA